MGNFRTCRTSLCSPSTFRLPNVSPSTFESALFAGTACHRPNLPPLVSFHLPSLPPRALSAASPFESGLFDAASYHRSNTVGFLHGRLPPRSASSTVGFLHRSNTVGFLHGWLPPRSTPLPTSRLSALSPFESGLFAFESGSIEMEFDLNEEPNNLSNNDNDTVVEPAVGMCFTSALEYADFCHKYANQSGFHFRTRTCELFDEFKEKGQGRRKADDEVHYEMMKRLRLHCVKGGKKMDETLKSQVTGCGAYVDARMKDGRMTVTVLMLEHNHPMDPSNSRFMVNYKYMTEYHKRRILNNDAAGVPVKKNFNSLVVESGGHENLPFSQRDMRNMLGIERRRTRLHGDVAAIEEYFKKMKAENPDFFCAIERDSEGRLMNLFWSNARCRAAARDFGDVVTFDTTHLTNRYGMPFAPFIGVNHHGSSIVLACGLLSHEDADTFVWIFDCWLKCMGRPPGAILTDQCKAINKAVGIVFPSTRHRLCLFHILLNASRNLGKHPRFKEITKSMNVVVHDSLTLDEFEEAWVNMVEDFQLHNYSWIKEAYMERRKWVPGYWKDSFWAGMSSMQRSEGIHFYFKGYMNMNSGLKLFIDQFQMALANKVEEEKKLNANTMDRPFTCNGAIPAEDVFHKAYTNAKFKEFQDEVCGLLYTNATKVTTDGDKTTYEDVEKIVKPVWRTTRKCFKTTIDRGVWDFTCSCRLFEFRGILCKHIIQVIEIEEIKTIPEKYVLDRWRKNLVREYERIQVNYYDPNECERVKRYCGLSLKNDYLVSLALHNDATYNAYLEGVDKLQNTLESMIGISCNNVHNLMAPSGKVYGRRRLQKREENERYIAKEKKTAADALKDPLDCRRKGRARTKRTIHASEKGSFSKKKKKENNTTELGDNKIEININEPPPWECSNFDINEPPPQDWIKLNTAGVSKGNPAQTGGGGLLRLSDGSFLTAYVFLCGHCEALTAEIWAIFHGLQLAMRLGLPRLILELIQQWLATS